MFEGLAKNSGGRVPGTVGSIEQPPPIAPLRHQDPYRFAERSGQMRQRGIDGENEVETLDDPREVEEIDAMAARFLDSMGGEERALLRGWIFLQTDPIDHGGCLKKRPKEFERGAPFTA